jgi:asparagine synthase (glutamine-hydrolysing)
VCGIAGFGSPESHDLRQATSILASMVDSLVHRGPDGRGSYVDDTVALGMRRLAVIDIANGEQPVTTENGRFQLILNGEIYNYRDLASSLQSRGHVLKSHSDTEVLVHLFEDCGTEFAEHLDGMFAIAVWDRWNHELVLARDPFGEKPLFYTETPAGGIVFGSEIKSLLPHADTPREIDTSRIREFLTFDCIPEPHTMIRRVQKLPAGHVLTWRPGSRADVWRAMPRELDHEPRLDEDRPAESLRSALQSSVELRLNADVPVGMLLSGGLDSSAVAAMIPKNRREHVHAFSIGFESKSYDESGDASIVAGHLGLRHHVWRLRPDDLIPIIDQIPVMFDDPVADASILPTRALTNLTREYVTVALGGDGADELFAGYATYQAHAVARHLEISPAFVARIAAGLANRLPANGSYMSLNFKAQRFVGGIGQETLQRHLTWMAASTIDEQERILPSSVFRDATDPVDAMRRVAGPGRLGWLDQVRQQDLSRYLRDVVLAKVDRASMASSLEIRAPFLSNEIWALAKILPQHELFRRLSGKQVLRDAVADLLPNDTIKKAKHGFAVPIAEWFRSDLHQYTEDVLAPDRVQRFGLFDDHAPTELLKEHTDGLRDHRKLLWALLTMQLWCEWLASQPPGRLPQPDS